MGFTNIEIKAKTFRLKEIKAHLLAIGAEYRGRDHQTDTYFHSPGGRLKLRQGNIENALIYYERKDDHGPKQSDFNLVPVVDGVAFKELLTRSLGIKVVVEKQRDIFIDNVKFHLDSLSQLGDFVEIEASNKYKPLSLVELRHQCEDYIRQFDINEADYIRDSYSDMLLALRG